MMVGNIALMACLACQCLRPGSVTAPLPTIAMNGTDISAPDGSIPVGPGNQQLYELDSLTHDFGSRLGEDRPGGTAALRPCGQGFRIYLDRCSTARPLS